ncbi:OmpP1/FadL family transporter [Oligoflexus tunisiensis]|uniref:OmpP1/FadL family transporter n=1 Tax=Oligoflexus tunisiensis TaxID=708132 RepID=UPI00114CEC65|nr:outer membrane protein transport protein [Oligoflexus tunisiensis]
MTRLFGRRAILGILACLASPSHANVFDTYGLGASTVALGNATTAGGPTAYAAYSNPALLVKSDRSEIASAAMLTQFNLQDLPAGEAGRLPADLDRESQADALQGGSLGLNLKLTDTLHFGLAAYLPQGRFGRIKGLSPYEATYLRYSEQQQKPAAYTALAIQGPWDLSFGVGAYYSLRARGLLQVSLDSQESEGRIEFLMEPVVVPYFGVSWSVGNWVLAAMHREAQETESSIESSFAFSTESAMIPFDASTSLIPFYDPALTRIGFAWTGERLQVMGSVERASWSRFNAPVVTITGADVAALSVENRPGSANLRDTQAVRLGLAAPLAILQDRLELRAGLEAHTSANRPKTPSYVVDPERRTLALGTAYNFAPDSQGHQLTLDAAYQLSQLSSLSVQTPKGLPIALDGSSTIQTFVGGLRYAL